jgi:ATP-dependent DNA ligase
LIEEAMARLPSCTIDGEAVACDDQANPSFDLLWRRTRDDQVFLYVFDLIELSGDDRRATLSRSARSTSAGCSLMPLLG